MSFKLLEIVDPHLIDEGEYAPRYTTHLCDPETGKLYELEPGEMAMDMDLVRQIPHVPKGDLKDD